MNNGSVKLVREERSARSHAITLVHGTFAADAEWVRPGSCMRERLAEAHGDNCLVTPFFWSGANNNFERILAAQDLITHLKGIEAAHPTIRHILIAHSHGGNLALQAAAHGLLTRPVDGICCLATPFLHARLRDRTELSSESFQFTIWALLQLPFFVWFVMGASGSVSWALAHILWAFGSIVATFLISAYVGGFLFGGTEGLRPLAENLVDWTHARSPTSNLKILRTPGDEASLVLSVGQLTAWASRRVIEQHVIVEKMNRFSIRVRSQKLPHFVRRTAFVLSVLTVIIFALRIVTPTVTVLLPYLGAAVVGFVSLVVVLKTTLFNRFLFGLGAITLILALLLHRMLLGTSYPKRARKESDITPPRSTTLDALLALMIEMNAESTPEGDWRVKTLAPSARSPFGDLSHSVYNHPVAISQVVEWVGMTRLRVDA